MLSNIYTKHVLIASYGLYDTLITKYNPVEVLSLVTSIAIEDKKFLQNQYMMASYELVSITLNT